MKRIHSQKAMFLASIIPSPTSPHMQKVRMTDDSGDDRYFIEALSTPPGSVTMRLVHEEKQPTLWESYESLDAVSDFVEIHHLT